MKTRIHSHGRAHTQQKNVHRYDVVMLLLLLPYTAYIRINVESIELETDT